MKILVVDDDAIFRRLVTRALQKAGYETLESTDAKTAIDLLERELIVMVITDVMMPDMNGFDLLAHILEKPHLSRIPVLVCSALGAREAVVKAVRLKASCYLVKPLDIQQLRDRVREIMNSQVRPLSDLTATLARLDLTASAYFEVLGSFITEVSSLLPQLEPVGNGAGTKCQTDSVISLQGAARNLGAQRVADTLERLRVTLPGGDAPQALPVCLELKREIALLRELVDTLGRERISTVTQNGGETAAPRTR